MSDAATERREGCVSESAIEDWMQRRELVGLPSEGLGIVGRAGAGGTFSKKEKGSDLAVGSWSVIASSREAVRVSRGWFEGAAMGVCAGS